MRGFRGPGFLPGGFEDAGGVGGGKSGVEEEDAGVGAGELRGASAAAAAAASSGGCGRHSGQFFASGESSATSMTSLARTENIKIEERCCR